MDLTQYSKQKKQITEAISNEDHLISFIKSTNLPILSKKDFFLLKDFKTGGQGQIKLGQISSSLNIKDKVIVKTISSRRQFNNFISEGKILLKYKSQYLPRVYGFYEEMLLTGNKTYGIILEYIEGYTIKDLITNMKKDNFKSEIDSLDKIFISLKICEALCFLHKNNILHSDLKPENIIMDLFGQIKILDLGISRIVDSISKSVLIEYDEYSFSPSYVLPESVPINTQIESKLFPKNLSRLVINNTVSNNILSSNNIKLCLKSDIWNLGLVIIELFSYIKPWCIKVDDKKSYMNIISLIVKKFKYSIPILIKDQPILDKIFKNIIKRCVHYAVELRPTAEVLYSQLKTFFISLMTERLKLSLNLNMNMNNKEKSRNDSNELFTLFSTIMKSSSNNENYNSNLHKKSLFNSNKKRIYSNSLLSLTTESSFNSFSQRKCESLSLFKVMSEYYKVKKERENRFSIIYHSLKKRQEEIMNINNELLVMSNNEYSKVEKNIILNEKLRCYLSFDEKNDRIGYSTYNNFENNHYSQHNTVHFRNGIIKRAFSSFYYLERTSHIRYYSLIFIFGGNKVDIPLENRLANMNSIEISSFDYDKIRKVNELVLVFNKQTLKTDILILNSPIQFGIYNGIVITDYLFIIKSCIQGKVSIERLKLTNHNREKFEECEGKLKTNILNPIVISSKDNKKLFIFDGNLKTDFEKEFAIKYECLSITSLLKNTILTLSKGLIHIKLPSTFLISTINEDYKHVITYSFIYPKENYDYFIVFIFKSFANDCEKYSFIIISEKLEFISIISIDNSHAEFHKGIKASYDYHDGNIYYIGNDDLIHVIDVENVLLLI